MANMYKIGTTATTIRTENGYTIIRYHQTDVVKFNQDEVILNTGGWWTATTKARMNQASNQFDLGFRVYQHNYKWFVDYKGDSIPFNGRELVMDR